MVPSKLVKTEKDLDEYRTKYDAMMQLKPLKENVSFRFTLYLQDYTESWRLFRICQAISVNTSWLSDHSFGRPRGPRIEEQTEENQWGYIQTPRRCTNSKTWLYSTEHFV